jgi:hypothetical protein
MQEQLEILRRRPARFTVPPERGEPLVWIERCVIWLAPGHVVRDIPFKRGLNIIYSPDPGDDRSDPRGRALGHAAGKTLLCRLLRYCLGEPNFGPPSLRRRVAQILPDAYVGIQARIAGQTWSVARPLGTRHKEFASAGTPVESVLSTNPGKLGAFWDGLDAAVMGPVRDVVKLRHDLSWMHVLAWLARDQESRFAHPLAWRASAAESESPVLGMPQEVLAYAVRVLLGLMTSDESIEQDKLSAVLEEKDRARSTARQLRAELARLAARVLGANRVSVAGTLPTPLEGNRLVAQAEETVRKLKEELATLEASNCRDHREVERDALLSEVGAIRSRLAATEAEATATRQWLSRCAAAAPPTAEAVKMRLGTDTCPVCKVPIDEVLAKGCALAVGTGAGSQGHSSSWREAELRAQQERLAMLDRDAQRIRELGRERAAAFASEDAHSGHRER